MNCKDLEPLIYLHAEGELSEQEQQQVRLHLETCEACRKLDASLRQMRTITLNQERIPESLPTAESVIRQVESRPGRKVVFMLVLRMAAATILLLLVSVLVFQEISFSRNLTALEQQMQRNRATGPESAESECMQRLKRRLHSPAFPGGYQAINTLSEDQINGYLQQVCGTGASDAGALMEILQDAGVESE